MSNGTWLAFWLLKFGLDVGVGLVVDDPLHAATANLGFWQANLAAGEKVDLVLSDIVMPGGTNGWDLAERATQMRPSIRVLLTSGYALETMAAHGRLRDGAMILTKPYRKVELARRLRLLSEQST